MATTTTNFGLSKPAYTDAPDIAVINANMDTIDTNMSIRLAAKSLTSAGGSVTFTDSRIKTTSLIDVYATLPNIAPSAISAAAGTCTVTFDAQSAAFDVCITVRN